MIEDEVEMIGPGGKRVWVSKYLAKQSKVLKQQGLRPVPEVIPQRVEAPPVKAVKEVEDAVEVESPKRGRPTKKKS